MVLMSVDGVKFYAEFVEKEWV